MFVESQDPHQIRLVNEEDLPGKDDVPGERYQKPKFKSQKVLEKERYRSKIRGRMELKTGK